MTVMGAAGTTAVGTNAAATGGGLWPGVGKELIDEMGDLAQQVVVSLDRPIFAREITTLSKNGRKTQVNRVELTAFELFFMVLLYELWKKRMAGGTPDAPITLPAAIQAVAPAAMLTPLTPGLSPISAAAGAPQGLQQLVAKYVPEKYRGVSDIALTPALVSPGPIGATAAYAKMVMANMGRARTKAARARWVRKNRELIDQLGITPTQQQLEAFLDHGTRWW